jgi:hypothetical protein
VTHDTTRKSFLGKVLGLAAVGALAPVTVARAIVNEKGGKTGKKQAAFSLQRQDRAVARRNGAA